MADHNILSKIPKEGFIKVVKPSKNIAVSSSEKAALIRKGNRLFNEGDITLAAKIFFTLNYTDGMTRVGDYLYHKNDYIEALAIFKSVGDEGRIEKTSEKMAKILSNWLDE